MKKRVFWLIGLSLLCVFALAGCRCDPSSESWHVQSFQADETFVDGTEHLVTYTGVPSVRDPFAGMQKEFVSISFEENGKVTFRPGTGEVLTGTYTCQHNGSGTDFTVVLDNGETFTGNAASNPYGSAMSFTFRDRPFSFAGIKGDAKEYYDRCMKDLTDSIRYWSSNTGGDIPLNPCNISAREDAIWLAPEGEGKPFRLDQVVAVRCFRMDDQNNLHPMDAIEQGDCFYAQETFGGITFVTLYYIDPLPENG